MIGGAGLQHSAAGGFSAAYRSSGLREFGRWVIQMWSFIGSMPTPTTTPTLQRFGSGFGHVQSYSNFGRLPPAGACPFAWLPAIPERTCKPPSVRLKTMNTLKPTDLTRFM